MKKSRKAVRIVSVALGSVLVCGALTAFAGCGGKKDALVLMSEELNGLFNPFYSTAGTDMSVVGQTQISMLGTDEEGHIAYGDKEPVVVKDYEEKTENGNTVYTFVLKNGIKFSDGVPLTMNDVMFNIYVYLDPAYTGSTTMYSTKIKGLQEYRLQTNNSDSDAEDFLTVRAANRARNRRAALVNLFEGVGRRSVSSTDYNADVTKMRNAINSLNDDKIEEYNIGWEAYKLAIAPFGDKGDKDKGYEAVSDAAAKAQLLEDYNKVVGSPNASDGLFWKELENDWASAQSQFAEAPYTNQPGKEVTNSSGIKFNEVSSFMAYEGYVEYTYEKVNGKDNYNHITGIKFNYDESKIKTKEQALQRVYDDNINFHFNDVITGWATAQELLNDFTGLARDVIMHENVGKNALQYANISGVVSLGHTTETQTVVLADANGTNARTYTVAHQHDALGRPSQPDTYDVLQITVEGSDPKAIWNFGFTIAPWHYYSDPSQSDLQVNIAENKFGVRWSDFKFQTDVLQGSAKTYTYKDDSGKDVNLNFNGVTKNGVPLGAGPYVATDRGNKDYPSYAGFMSNNIVYYKANKNFFEGVEGADKSLHAPYIEKMRYQVVSSANAIPALKQGSVDYAEPQLTKENYDTISKMKGITHLETWQLGYGYIGINAGRIPDIDLRRAIMAAMDTTRALSYYRTGTAATIYWPMSLVSWAYPRTEGNKMNPLNYLLYKEDDNGTDYAKQKSDERAKELISEYMEKANVKAGDSRLTVTFTIAGASLTEHPCYAVFQHAKTLLEECGWKINISPDVNALTKLSTGSLTVWAAAWGSTIDPDMYQVYHKNSTATSVLAWGYPEILNDPTGYSEENTILNDLATKIDAARQTTNESERIPLYKEAMKLVLDLAVELPVYQRQVMYGLNTKVIDIESLPHTESGELLNNPFTSPLSRIWEVKFVG